MKYISAVRVLPSQVNNFAVICFFLSLRRMQNVRGDSPWISPFYMDRHAVAKKVCSLFQQHRWFHQLRFFKKKIYIGLVLLFCLPHFASNQFQLILFSTICFMSSPCPTPLTSSAQLASVFVSTPQFEQKDIFMFASTKFTENIDSFAILCTFIVSCARACRIL